MPNIKVLDNGFPVDAYIFQDVDGVWICLSFPEFPSPTLAEFLSRLNVVVDDDCQFCRFIRYEDDYKITITFRVYGGKIGITINKSKSYV